MQAIGTDDAGRRQYLYHEAWRARRDREKYRRVLELGRHLPGARRTVDRDLDRPDLDRSRVLALAFRLLDDAYFRAGGEAYARHNGSYGLATLRRDQVAIDGERVAFSYPAKSGQRRECVVTDPQVQRLVQELCNRAEGGPELLAWRSDTGWHDVTSTDVVGDVRQRLGPDASPKDLRTWHATVLAATALANAGPPPARPRQRSRVVAAVMRDVAEELGNTPAVCRASYVDPRLVDLWERGHDVGRVRTRAGAERATLSLLG